jgi:hypothetical protein
VDASSPATTASFREIVAKTVVTQTVTYFVVGLLASTLLDYAHWFAESSLGLLMRPTTDRMVMAGPLFQPVRGFFFGWVFFLLRDVFFDGKRGWLWMWFVLVVLGIVNPFGPAPGSIEGLVYTRLPLADQLKGLPEVIVQSLALSFVVSRWIGHRGRWPTWVMGAAFLASLALPALGLLVAPK